MLKIINKILGVFNLSLGLKNKFKPLPTDFDSEHKEIWSKVSPYTMTSPERIYTLIESVKHIEKHKVAGAIVECGVWKGGSMMAAIDTLNIFGNTNRELYLYDTFEGMSEPGENDFDHNKETAKAQLSNRKKSEEDLIWAFSPIEQVQKIGRAHV